MWIFVRKGSWWRRRFLFRGEVEVEVDEKSLNGQKRNKLANRPTPYLFLTCNPAAQATSATPPMSLSFCGIAMRREEREGRTGESRERETLSLFPLDGAL